MKMSSICPYPGLRPFTEEESIFFKGRDLHIEQVTAQLEKKKFVMLTGASGDGKSSLIYAGVIPNARAGFFKAKHNNWIFATFRPERSPLENLSKSVAAQMSLNYEVVRKELGYGFSGLINLYKQSSFFLDQNSETFKNADETEKKKLKRRAGNLFILIDQFEEFFTNPENYSQGVPSGDSQTVINLLLETASLALANDLPIYIVCTMRSDYIGQCAAFRGLPEMIGFSQFFVPRLKRKEIHQVIVDPAILSGNKISNRLTEVLINELSDGFDQLPVLQHALNALWHISTKLKDAGMDFAHLSMVCGLNPSFLSTEDKEKFDNYLDSKPAFWREYHKEYSLSHVLSTNANLMFEMAHGYYYQEESIISSLLLPDKTGTPANTENSETFFKEELQEVVKKTFQCLTRIDEGRAVRNRMTLQEITDIINDPKIDYMVVCRTINFYREQGNTFIHPFISDNPESRNMKPETVLDITHESLIRNWSRLRDWANEEYENYLTWQDFNKQLQRWVSSKKSSGYLLPIGPLNYFEEWFNKTKPNKYWLARYSPTPTLPKGEGEKAREEKLLRAEQTLLLAKEFLRKSARKLFVTRTVMHYGANKVAAFFAIIALIVACSYYYLDFRKKQNDAVIEKIEERGLELLTSSKVKNITKANFVINLERLHSGSFETILNNIDDDSKAFDIAYEMFWAVENFSEIERDTLNRMAYPIVKFLDNRMQNLFNCEVFKNINVTEANLNRLNKLTLICTFTLNHDSTNVVAKQVLSSNLWMLNKAIINHISQPVDSIFQANKVLNQSLLLIALLKNQAPLIDFQKYLQLLSPYESIEAKNRFDRFYPKNVSAKIDWSNSMSHNSGYQILGCFYAVNNRVEYVNRCLDSIITYNKDYNNFQFQNFFTMMSYYLNQSVFSPDDFINIINKYSGLTNTAFHNNFMKIISNISSVKIYQPMELQEGKGDGEKISNYLISYSHREKIWNLYLRFLYEEIKEKDELNYELAMYYKKRGIFLANSTQIYQNDDFIKKTVYNDFDLAFKHFLSVSPNFLDQTYTIGKEGNAGTKKIKRYIMFLYPHIFEEDPDVNYYSWVNPFVTTAFADYISEKELRQFYKTDDVLEVYEGFLYVRYFSFVNRPFKDKYDYSYYDFGRMLNLENIKTINQEFLELVALNTAFAKNDTIRAFNMYKKLNLKNIFLRDFQSSKGISDLKGMVHQDLLKKLSQHLAVNNKLDESMKIINNMTIPYLKRNSLIDITFVLQEKGPIENTFVYLDTLFCYIEKEQRFGLKLFNVLGMTGSNNMFDLSLNLIKDVNDKNKPRAMINFVRGLAYNGSYFKATTYIPYYISSNNELELYNELFHSEAIKRSLSGGWNKIDFTIYGNLDAWLGDEELLLSGTQFFGD